MKFEKRLINMLMPQKLVLALLMAAGSYTVALADNKLTVTNVDILDGGQAVVSVLMENQADITSIQARVNLPKGLKLLPIDKDEWGEDIYFKLNQSRTYDPNDPDAQSKQRHEIGFGALYQEPGADKNLVIITHPKNSPFVGSSGEIFSFKVQANATLADNTEISLSDAHFSTTGAQDLLPTIKNGQVSKLAEPAGIGILSADNFSIYPIAEHELILSLENNYDLKALQFDLHLPAGLEIVPGKEGASTNAEGRMTNSRLNPDANQLADGTWRITYSNPQSSDKIKLVAGEGPIIGIILKADNDLLDPSEIKIDHIVLTRPNLKEIVPEDLTITVNNPKVAEKAAEAQEMVEELQDKADALVIADEIKNYEGHGKDEVAEKVSEAEDAIADADKKVDDLADYVGDRIDDGTIATDPVQEKIEADKAAAEEAIAAAEAAIDAAEDVYEQKLAEQAANDAAYKKLSAEIEELQKKLNEAISNLNTACPDVKDDFADDVKVIQDAIDELKGDLDAKNEAVELTAESALDAEAVKAIEDAIEKLKKDAAEAQENFNENQESYGDLKKDIKELENALADAKEAIDDLDDVKLEEYQEAIDAIQEEIDGLDAKIEEAHDNGTLTADTHIDDIDKGKKQEILDDINELVETAKAEQALEDKLEKDAQTDLAELQKAYDAALEKANKNGLKYEDYQKEKDAAKEDLTNLPEFLKENDGNLRDEKVSEQLEKLLDDAKKDVKALADKIDDLIAHQLIPGDINKDGKVDASDLALFIQALGENKLPAANSDDFKRYDANANGVINIADAQAIFNLTLYGNVAGKK